MNTYVALFRGINVGGKNVLPMKGLVLLLEKIGARGVRTYIQSGNAVFQSAEHDPSRLAALITAEVKKHYGFESHVLLLGLEEIAEAMAMNPFPEAEADPRTLHLYFLAAAPKSPDLNRLDNIKTTGERFVLRNKIFYLHAPEGVGRSRLAAGIEKSLGVTTTARNWNTVCRIKELAEQ